MPEWMEPFRDKIVNTGGNPIKELANDHTTTFFGNAPRAALCIAVKSQIELLTRLNDEGIIW